MGPRDVLRPGCPPPRKAPHSPESLKASGYQSGRRNPRLRLTLKPVQEPARTEEALGARGIPMGTKAKLSWGALVVAAASTVGAIYAIITESPQSAPPQTSVGAPSAPQTGARPESPSSTATTGTIGAPAGGWRVIIVGYNDSGGMRQTHRQARLRGSDRTRSSMSRCRSDPVWC